MPNNGNQNKASGTGKTIMTTVAGVAIGAAVAFGAYMFGKQEGHEEAQHHYNERVNVARNMTPKVTTPASSPGEEDQIVRECDICLRNFKKLMDADEEIHTTPCGHIFCKNCIEEALRKQPNCPICRGDVRPGQTLRIYL